MIDTTCEKVNTIMAENGAFEEGFFEDAMLWLDRDDQLIKLHEQLRIETKQTNQHGVKAKILLGSESLSPMLHQHNAVSAAKPPRPRNLMNKAVGGPGMQAIFLSTNHKSSGTGVFLPRRAGTKSRFNTKPAYSPVLLPSRVVQTLNLNVHELGQPIKLQPGLEKTEKGIDVNMVKDDNDKKENDLACSPEIFLPEEWTY